MTLNDEFDALVSRLEAIQEQGLELYSKLADEIINDRITDPRKIELVLDGLLDFSYSDRYEILYKKICRHIFRRHTLLVEEHVAMFRERMENVEKDVSANQAETETTDDEKIDVAAREILERHRAAFEELAKL